MSLKLTACQSHLYTSNKSPGEKDPRDGGRGIRPREGRERGTVGGREGDNRSSFNYKLQSLDQRLLSLPYMDKITRKTRKREGGLPCFIQAK